MSDSNYKTQAEWAKEVKILNEEIEDLSNGIKTCATLINIVNQATIDVRDLLVVREKLDEPTNPGAGYGG